MKKLMIVAACVMFAAVTQAAAVGWTLATGAGSTYADNAYKFFVIGQNGATSIATITALLDAGTSVDSYAFGSGTVASTGSGMVAAANSGKSLDAGTYTGFFVLFDAATPKAGSSKYAVISGASTLTKTIGGSTATVAFASGSQSAYLSDSDNWKAFGPTAPAPGPSDVPEPTTGLLMLLGVAGLALRRRA